jgi:hypothetical protein
VRLLDLEQVFPKLVAAGYEETSKKTCSYNCIAWAAHDTHRWWWPHPDAYWPAWIKQKVTVDCFVRTFRWFGYRECNNSRREFAFDKVALYAVHTSGVPMVPPTTLEELRDWHPKHMARQMPDGAWTSKAGTEEDITHYTLDAVERYGPNPYGCPVLYMKRFVLVSWVVRLVQLLQWKMYGQWRT